MVMLRLLLLWLPFLLLSCAPLTSMTGPTHAAPRLAPRAHCMVIAGAVVCSEQRTSLAELGIAEPLRSIAPRRLGGLFLVDAQGVLHRVDARGVVTGHYEQPVEQVVNAGSFVCLRAPAGVVLCAVDRHDDRGCTQGDSLPDFIPVAQVEGTLRGLGQGTFCDERDRCRRLTRPCQTACLRFPSCHAALRCVDTCPVGQPALVALPIGPAQTFLAAPFIITPASSDS